MSGERRSRFATVALAGRPNAGKSTLLNALVGEKLAITSPKPQSTRHAVQGIVTEGDCQLVFVDPPGLFGPSNLLQRVMVASAVELLNRSDILLHLHALDAGAAPPPIETLAPGLVVCGRPFATVFTKADLGSHAAAGSDGQVTFTVSAVTGQGLAELKAWCRDQAHLGPFQYEDDVLSTQNLRFFAAELVRESAFELLEQELPYALAAEVDQFREEPKPVYIRVVIHVERPSQKGMLIGKGGRTIKALGQSARAKIEALVGERVYVDLWVKVLPKWRTSSHALTKLGLQPSNDKRVR